MRRRALLLSMGACAAPLAGAQPASPGSLVHWPSGVRLLDGSAWGAEQVQGRAVVLVFWSLTCAFCERHNAHIDKLWRAVRDKPITVIGVVRGSDAPSVARHVQAKGWGFANTVDAAPLAAALSERRSVPLTVVVDKLGRLLEVVPGEMFEEDVMGYLRLA